MKILVSTGPSLGLYCPVVPMAWALRAAGHEVLVAVPETIAAVVNGSGLPHISTYGPMHMREVMAHDRQGNPIGFATAEPQMLEQAGRGFGRLAARTLPGLLDVATRWQPDVILSEPHAYSAGIASRVLGVPWVEHGVGLGYFREMDKSGAAELEPELTGLGFAGLPDPDLVLEPCPRSLLPATSNPGTAMRYVQYDPPATIPSWAFDERTRPRLLLTLGTVAPAAGGVRVLKELVNVLPKLGVELVVAVADDVVPQLGSLPDEVIAAGFLPLAAIMPSCDLIVHHCGGGSTMASILAGLPQLLIPQPIVAEQYDSARRVTAFGAALQLVDQPIDPAVVLENCERLLTEQSFADRAHELRAEVAAMPTPIEVVSQIEDLVFGLARL
ncbi:MAG: novM [Glaciihabitans sp.]|nr:novM [Glaciihabitans sp.]